MLTHQLAGTSRQPVNRANLYRLVGEEPELEAVAGELHDDREERRIEDVGDRHASPQSSGSSRRPSPDCGSPESSSSRAGAESQGTTISGGLWSVLGHRRIRGLWFPYRDRNLGTTFRDAIAIGVASDARARANDAVRVHEQPQRLELELLASFDGTEPFGPRQLSSCRRQGIPETGGHMSDVGVLTGLARLNPAGIIERQDRLGEVGADALKRRQHPIAFGA